MALEKYHKDYFTEEEKATIQQVVNSCWAYIGDDMFYNEDGEYDESMTFHAGEVMEVSLDAGRWKEHGGVTDQEAFQTLITKLYTLDGWEEFKKAAVDIMPYEIYGM